MWKRCVPLLGLGQSPEGKPRRKELKNAPISMDLSVQLRDITVRVIHAGGREERYTNTIPVSILMEKYPGMCVARPEVFKNPHESVLLPEENLYPGQKYYVIPCTTVKKLKRKHRGKEEGKENCGEDLGGESSDESVCSADFYVSKENWTISAQKRSRKGKKSFVPPVQRPRIWKGLDWEPSLTSVQELSP